MKKIIAALLLQITVTSVVLPNNLTFSDKSKQETFDNLCRELDMQMQQELDEKTKTFAFLIKQYPEIVPDHFIKEFIFFKNELHDILLLDKVATFCTCFPEEKRSKIEPIFNRVIEQKMKGIEQFVSVFKKIKTEQDIEHITYNGFGGYLSPEIPLQITN